MGRGDIGSTYVLRDTGIVTGHSDMPLQGEYILRVRDLPQQDKPRERLIAHGPSDLSMAELVAVLLGVGTRKEDVLSMARRILQEYGERAILHETNPGRLSQTLDIPLAKACQMVACFELGRRYFATRVGQPTYIRTAEQAFAHLSGMLGLQKEQLRGLYLNSRYQVIHEETISVGSLTANIVHPREVFRPAVEHGAVAVIVAHNHPSGELSPTQADHEVTAQLVATGKILGIDLLDHLVIAGEAFVSIIDGYK